MAKQEPWRRIDYDSRQKKTITVIPGATQTSGIEDQVQELIRKKLPPTQAQLFRAYAGPTKVSGGTAGITVPATAQADDLIFLFVSFGKYYPSILSYTDGWDYIDYWSAFGDTEDGRPYQQGGYDGAGFYVFYKNVTTGDAGTDFDIEMVWSDNYTPTEDTDLNIILYMVVMNSEYIYPNYYGEIGYGESDGNANEMYGTSFYTGGEVRIATTSRNWPIFYIKAIQGVISSTPPSGVTELLDTSNVNHSLWVGYSVAQFIQTVTYNTDEPVVAYELFGVPPNPNR